jgi:hypothetical protein
LSIHLPDAMLDDASGGEVAVDLASMTTELAAVVQAALAQPKTEDPDFSMWWGVLGAFVIVPVAMLAVKFYAERRRDRKTKELIAESNKDGPVPELPKDFEVPQVVPRRRESPSRRRFR